MSASPAKKIDPEKIPARTDILVELAKRDCRYFIQTHVRIEDRDTKGLAVPFRLWSAQQSTLGTFIHDRLTIVLKARQLGLTWLALSYIVHRLLFHPGFAAVALSKREDPDAKELVRRITFILRHLPPWMIRERKGAAKEVLYEGPTWESTTLAVTVHHPGSEPSGFTSMSAAPDSGRSFTANLVLLDEWAFQQWAHEIWSAAYPTINRPTGGQVIGLSTGKRGTLFEEVWNEAGSGVNGFTPVFLPWHTDPRRTDAWYEQTKRDLPNTYRAEYPATSEEAFTVGQGAFFPQWDTDLHVIPEPAWYPPSYCQLYGAYDAGFGSRACFKWYAVFPDGSAVNYREYYPQQVIDPEQAKIILTMSKTPTGEQERLVATVADPSCWNKQSGSGESTAEIFTRQGLYMRKADNDLANGWRRLHQWLFPVPDGQGGKRPSLRFTWACGNSIRCYPAAEQKKTNPEDISDQSEHHVCDCDRYFVMSRPRPDTGGDTAIMAGGFPAKRPTRGSEDDDDEDDAAVRPGFYR